MANLSNRDFFRIVLALVFSTAALCRAGNFVEPGEMARKAEWVRENLPGDAKKAPPFSFVYEGKPSGALLPSWSRKDETARLDESRTRYTTTWTDPTTHLEVRCVAVEYSDFPAVEWTVYFKNTGSEKTPILENIQGLDARFERAADGEFVLHHCNGDTFNADLYQPLEQTLGPNARQRFAPNGGRPTNGEFPYYDIVMPDGGLLMAVGWPGQWATSFIRDAERGLQIIAGQELTHLYLESGEEVRTPLIALLFWQGANVQRSHNLWRRWMWAHNVPRTADGALPPPILFGNTSLEFNEMINANEENQEYFIDRYREEGVPIDYWWMDAGWYPCDGQWPKTGTWEPDTKRFPKGLRAISDHARTKGIKTLVWFEPERVAGGTWLATNHPEWLLDGKLLNLGNPEARKWLTDHVDRTLREQGIDLYRQDFNMDPLGHWRKNDAPDRQGITETLHVQGYLAYWDELRRRHPKLIIDSCASGGRRNDLETLRRAVPLHPTDYNYGDLTAKQAFHFSLFQWIPYYGSNTVPVDTVDAYAFRSGHGMGTVLGYDMRRKDLDYDRLRTLAEQWKQVVPCYYGDFYPITSCHRSESDWMAWQFHRPEQDDGVVQAFRRPGNKDASVRLPLRGLNPLAAYELKDLDQESAFRMSGRELIDHGLPVERNAPRQAVVVQYKRVEALSAIIKTTPRKGEMPLPVLYDGRGSYDPSGAIVKYVWQFSDGSTAEGRAVEHVFNEAGNHTARLTVTNDKGATDTAATTIVVTPVDSKPPAIVAVRANGNPNRVIVAFSEPVEKASAETVANYTVDRGIAIQAAALDADRMTATLQTSPLSEGATYTLAVKNVRDLAAARNPTAPGARTAFQHTSLIAHWRLDDGAGTVARDSSGNGHDATLENEPAWVETPRGGALRFDGVDDYVVANTYFPDLAMPFTISVWVNPAATQVRHADILGNHGEPFVGINLQQEGDMTNAFGFGYGDGQKWQGTGHAQLKAGEWQHVAVVCDGDEAILYVDGEAKARRAAKGPLAPNPAQNFKIGQGYHTGRYFHGMIRDVRIYGRALSAAEIAAAR